MMMWSLRGDVIQFVEGVSHHWLVGEDELGE